MIALYDTASGLAIVELLDKTLKASEDLQKAFESKSPQSLLKLRDFLPYESTKDTLKAIQKMRQGKIIKSISKSLKTSLKLLNQDNIPSDNHDNDNQMNISSSLDHTMKFATSDPKLAKIFTKKFKFPCIANDVACELLRKVAQHYPQIAPQQSIALEDAQIGLAFRMARNELKLSSEKLDTMIIQAITLLESVTKEANTYAMKITEWYGWHFPELKSMISNILNYVAIVAQIGKRSSFTMMEPEKKEALLEILKNDMNTGDNPNQNSPESFFDSIVSLADTSIGLPLNDYDYESLKSLCLQTLELEDYRVQLNAYLNSRIKQICPNLALVLGDLVAAKLVAHAGSLSALSKKAGSTLQILGAEKALFRAIKTRSNTPKYGIMFNTNLVQQASVRNKGKMCRSIASKAVMAARIDYNQNGSDSSYGQNFRDQLERRAKKISQNIPKNFKAKPMQQRPKQLTNNFAKRGYHDSKFDLTHSTSKPKHFKSS